MKRILKQFAVGLFIMLLTVSLTACGDVHLSSFGDLTLKKFIKTLNKNIEQYSSGLVVPELTETTVTTDSGDVTVYTSAISSTITLLIIPSDSGQIIYLRQSKSKDAQDSEIQADDQVFAGVVFALMQTVDENADVKSIIGNLKTDTLWNTAAVTDADGFHYFYQNRGDANVLVIKQVQEDASQTASTE